MAVTAWQLLATAVSISKFSSGDSMGESVRNALFDVSLPQNEILLASGPVRFDKGNNSLSSGASLLGWKGEQVFTILAS